MIANRLCTLAMCGLSHGGGPERQGPSTRSFLLTPQSTAGHRPGHPGSRHRRALCVHAEASLHSPLPLPTRQGSPPGRPAALLTSCSGHLLEPSTPGQQHGLSGSQRAISPLLEGSAIAQESKWVEEWPPEGMASSLAASTAHRPMPALAPPGRCLWELHM